MRGANARIATVASNLESASECASFGTSGARAAASSARHCRACATRCLLTTRVAIPRSQGRASAHVVSNEERLRNAIKNVSLSTSSTASTPTRLLMYPPTGRAWRSTISVKARGSRTDLSMISLSVLTPSIPRQDDFGSRMALDKVPRLAPHYLHSRQVAVGASARQIPAQVRTSRFLRLWAEPCQYAP